MTACVEDGFVAIPDPHAELIAAKIFPDILEGIEFWCVWRQPKQAEVAGHSQALARLVPPGTVTDQHGMGVGADLLANLDQVYRHRLAADPGHGSGRSHRRCRRRHDGCREPPPDGSRAVPTDTTACLAGRRAPRPETRSRSSCQQPAAAGSPLRERQSFFKSLLRLGILLRVVWPRL